MTLLRTSTTRSRSAAATAAARPAVRLALPKGRIQAGVLDVLADAGIAVSASARGYRPRIGLEGVEAKLLKPQNVVEMLHAGSRDVGFAGADWVRELGAELVELVDLELDPVQVVAAAPRDLVADGRLVRTTELVVASEYERLTREWIESAGIDASFVRTFGATEVFPPEDADLIVDNTATGATLEANGLVVVDRLMTSTTRLYASRAALEDPIRREPIEELAQLVRSVVAARGRVLFEVNVPADRLDAVCSVLPCMDRPTIAALVGEGGYGVRAAVPRSGLPQLIGDVKARGGRDIVVSEVSQIVP